MTRSSGRRTWLTTWVAIAYTVVIAAVLGVVPVGAPPAAAAIPVHPYPTLELERTILTTPFRNRSTQHPGDIEGMAYDPVRNTIWASDDSKYRLFELDATTGDLLTIVSQSDLAAALRVQPDPNPPAGDPAGLTRANDLEALAYDATSDSLFAFAGHCCPTNPHISTVWRLTRPAPGAAFGVESYQALNEITLAGFPDDFSGVGAIDGQLWAGSAKTLYRYDYLTNAVAEQKLLSMSGVITGVGFASAGSNGPGLDDMWITNSKQQMYRFAWPSAVRMSNHQFNVADLGLGDSRAVEVVGDQLFLADGYDYYLPGTPEEFAIHVFNIRNDVPSAGLAANPPVENGEIVGGVPLTVEFSDNSTGRVQSWLWEFHDGTTSTDQHPPAFTYTSTGTFPVKLTVTNPNGSSTTTVNVRVTGRPSAQFSHSGPVGRVPDTIVFTDESTTSGAAITHWLWEFGDGSTSTLPNPVHQYTAPGPHTVALTVRNVVGESSITETFEVTTPPDAAFVTDTADGHVPLSVSFSDRSVAYPPVTAWSWDFGDGSPIDPNADPSHVYQQPGTYAVTMEVTNAEGTASTTHTITVTEPPVAAFTPSIVAGSAPLRVTFANSSTGYPAPGAWDWDFGDGARSDQAAPDHLYTVPGVYEVRLTATSTAGSDDATTTIAVYGPPTAAFTPSTTAGTAPLRVSFTDDSTATPSVTVWSWDFGDGSAASSERSPSHVYSRPGTYRVTLTVRSAGGTTSAQHSVAVSAVVPDYVGVRPARLADTRSAPTIDGDFSGIGRRATGALNVPVVGRGPIPATGVKAVVLNVTAIGPTAESYLTVWPAGSPQPTASNLNYVQGQTVPNLVVVPVGVGGSVALANAAGTVDLAIDVLGYFTDSSPFVGLLPTRITDTRHGGSTGDHREEGDGALGAGEVRRVAVNGRGGVPLGRGSVALNVTAAGASADTFLTVWPSAVTRPNASNLNVAAGQTVPNMVIVPVGADGAISIYNAEGQVDVLVDVLGWLPEGRMFSGLNPARVLDTRLKGMTVDGVAQGGGPITGAAARQVVILGRGGVPAGGVGSVVVNVTVTGPIGDSYLTVWPAGTDRPTASNLNFSAGQTVPNLVIVSVGANGSIELFTESGATDVIVDVLGWFPP